MPRKLFKKGDPKPPTSGRKKGTPNKRTLTLNNFAQVIVEEGMDKFREELGKLDGKQYLDTVKDMLEYVKPKLNRTTLVGDNNAPLVVKTVTLTKVVKEQNKKK